MFGSLAPMPETKATLVAQQRQLIAGHRKAQLFPGGHGELSLPQGASRLRMPNGDVFHFNPKAITAAHILQVAHAGRENDVLGLGPHSKKEIMNRIVTHGERPLAVVERDARGTETRASAGTHKTVAAQKSAMEADQMAGHSIAIEHPHHVIARRVVGILNGAA